MQQRIHKILADAGIASRRKAEDIVRQGRVTINGRPAGIGNKADTEKDEILLDHEALPTQKKRYILLHKPYGYVTSMSDPHEKKLVTQLVDVPEKIFPVGRLDKDTEGLLLLTNDGGFANKIMHPRYETTKTYRVGLQKRISGEDLQQLQRGLVVDGRRVRAEMKRIRPDCVEITLHEGRHKIVKRLFRKLGNYVTALNRIRIGSIRAGGIKKGQWRELTQEEFKGL
jgi:23S rRNA pseudouridine2605 synthase